MQMQRMTQAGERLKFDTALSDEIPKETEEDDEKDSTEEELEKLVFGDSNAFKNNLKQYSAQDTGDAILLEDNAGASNTKTENDLELAEDADIFFYDSGPANSSALPSSSLQKHFDDDSDDPPAWEDSDDERIRISLASIPRLRKLRTTADEDVIDGKEYIRRLRKQYEILHPKPNWAKQLEARQALRRRKKKAQGMADGASSSSSSIASDVSSADDSSTDEHFSAQPLAKLLKDMDSLTVESLQLKSSTLIFRPEVIDIQRSKDISGPQRSSITSLSFHPQFPLLLSSGPSSTLYMHNVNPNLPNPNPLITSLHIRGTALCNTIFHPDPSDPRIFLGARRRFFHIWNISTGVVEKVTRIYGHQHAQRSMDRFLLSPSGQHLALLGTARKGGGASIHILDAKTLQWAQEIRVESRGGIADFRWWRDSSGMSIAGKNGEVTEWDIVQRRPVIRWLDEGAVGITVLALGGICGRNNKDVEKEEDTSNPPGSDRYIAIGSTSGIINIYDRRSIFAKHKNNNKSNTITAPQVATPLRTLTHLTTPVSHLHFSPPDGQLLAIASQWKRDALRLVHLPSCTVYKNWPTSGTPLGRITALAWGNMNLNLNLSAGGDEDAGSKSKSKSKSKSGSKSKSRQRELALVVANEAGRIRMWEVRA